MQPLAEPAWRILHLLQMLLLIFWCWHYGHQLKSHLVLPLATALGFSFGGDLINSGLLPLEFWQQPRALLSIPFFAVTQLIYISLFWLACKDKAKHSRNASLVICPLLAYVMWAHVIQLDETLPAPMNWIALGYCILVLGMGFSAGCFYLARGQEGLLPALGGLSFVVSDALIGIAMANGGHPSGLHGHAVWLTYIMAQCLIARMLIMGVTLGIKKAA